MVERARLEIECAPKVYRGFESPPLRVLNFTRTRCIRADGLRKKIERLRKLVDFPVLRKAPVANRLRGGCIVFTECLQGRGCGGVFAAFSKFAGVPLKMLS